VSTADLNAVKAAAAHVVDRFGAFDRDAYFACFAPEATFLFHTTDRLLASRAEYEAEWASWVEGGFAVVRCSSHDGRVDLINPDVAVFTHRVLTTLHDADGDHDVVERETIVFKRSASGQWLGVHEHLSPFPT
jgi:ketosteroid isomerase-like protein